MVNFILCVFYCNLKKNLRRGRLRAGSQDGGHGRNEFQRNKLKIVVNEGSRTAAVSFLIAPTGVNLC